MIKNDKGQIVEAPVHGWFGLSYANYHVVPRLVLQEQSLDWQNRFIELMDEISETLEATPGYIVLRDEPGFTNKIPYSDDEDPDDRGTTIAEYVPLQDDPWANYRRGSVKKLISK